MQYEDYQTIPTLKIAISEHLYNTNALHDYISSYNISEDNLVFCKVYDECLQKLNAGEVDALISNVMDYNSLTMKMLERFHTTSNYICTKINNHIIYEINEALVRINLDYPSFFSDLNKKYYSERVATPLSRKEVECLKCLNSVQIPFVDGQGYLSHKENDKFVGILPKIADLVFNKLDLDYSTIDMGINGNDCDKFIKDNARVIVGCVYDNNWGKERNLRLSNPFFISEYSQLSRKDYEVDSKTCRVAAVKGFYYVDEYVLKNYSENQIIGYDNFVDCLDAIVSKKADITILNNYIAEYYQSLYKYNSLVHKLIGYNHPMCFGINEGSIFVVDIPTCCVSEKVYLEAHKTEINTSKVELKYNLKNKHILLCDDSEVNLLIATKLLEKMSCIVDTAENGQVCIEKFTASPTNYYDAILMDIRMPVMNGIEATKAIRALDREDAKLIPIIAMSANAFEEDVKRSLDSGMNAHLSKPVDPRKMYKTLSELISR